MNKTLAQVWKAVKNNSDKRVLVLGTFCAGKTTIAPHIAGAIDMDKIIWPLSDEDFASIPPGPWCVATGEAVTEIARRKITIHPGAPVFGTVLLPCDLIIYLAIDDDLLKQRVLRRGGNSQDLENAKNLRQYLSEMVMQSATPCINVEVSDD